MNVSAISGERRSHLNALRRLIRPAALLLALHLLLLSGLYQSGLAAMISTETTIKIDHSQQMRDRINQYLLREDIIALLESRGIDPAEVVARVDSLSDAELEHIADSIDELPAGSGFFETFIIILFLVFLILLITDISGYTDIFPFVNKQAATNKSSGPAVVEPSAKSQTASTQTTVGINPDTPLNIYFNPNSNDLTAKAYERLDRVALFMAQNPQWQISIKGFSDSTGTSSYDQMVSEVRANTVKNYLIAKGVEPSKISTVSGEQSQTGSQVLIEFK